MWSLVRGVVLGVFTRLANSVLRKSELVGFILYRVVAVCVMYVFLMVPRLSLQSVISWSYSLAFP